MDEIILSETDMFTHKITKDGVNVKEWKMKKVTRIEMENFCENIMSNLRSLGYAGIEYSYFRFDDLKKRIDFIILNKSKTNRISFYIDYYPTNLNSVLILFNSYVGGLNNGTDIYKGFNLYELSSDEIKVITECIYDSVTEKMKFVYNFNNNVSCESKKDGLLSIINDDNFGDLNDISNDY